MMTHRGLSQACIEDNCFGMSDWKIERSWSSWSVVSLCAHVLLDLYFYMNKILYHK